MSRIHQSFSLIFCGKLEHTAESDIVVVVELVNSLDLSTNVEFLDGLVQVDDGRVLWVTTEDELTLFGPKSGEIPRQQAPLEHEPFLLFDCVRIHSMRRQSSQIAFSMYFVQKRKKTKDGYPNAERGSAVRPEMNPKKNQNQKSRAKNSLVGAVDVVNGQDGQVTVVTEVTQSDASTSLELLLVDELLGSIEGDGHGENIAIGKAVVLTDTIHIVSAAHVA